MRVFLILIILFSCITACRESPAPTAPPEDRFRKVVLAENNPDLIGAAAFDFAPDGRIFMIHLSGHLRIFDPKGGKFITSGKFDGGEYGLIGMKLDPAFEKNNFIYLQYFVADTSASTLKPERRIMKISRFTMSADTVDLSSEINYLQIPYEHECCHTGGGMDFDSKGNLYVSTGDNTGAFFTIYAPIVHLPGHLINDGLRSAGNTNDLRGKILRIHPHEDGTWSIPEGNLFPPGTEGALPEIYIMGCRNPYRLSIDRRTDILYWGEVGPDAGVDSTLGPKGYDEFNQARKAGNYGWPLFIGNNKAYYHAIYEDNQPESNTARSYELKEKFDTANPVNFSANNTGLKALPPARPAMVWYPYDTSETFPVMGVGGRTAIGGPIYNYDPHLKSDVKFPEYFDGSWFVADWMRHWLKVIHLSKDSELQHIESFIPSFSFKKPVYMRFGPDGALYLLEFGTTWARDNADVKFVRIEYISGNRPPVARITAQRDKENGLVMTFSADQSVDVDGDELEYAWTDDKGQVLSTEKAFTRTYNEPGRHFLQLELRDGNGGSSKTDTTIWAGPIPQWTLHLANRSFYWDTIRYELEVNEPTGTTGMSPEKRDPGVTLQVLSPATPALNTRKGEVLLNESDCKACHHLELPSAGPSFNQIAARYSTSRDMVPLLAEKIINGGSGVWGTVNMSAHPQLTTDQAAEMVKYILALNKTPTASETLPQKGVIHTAKYNPDRKTAGRLLKLVASRADTGEYSGMAIGDSCVLRSAEVNPRDFDVVTDAVVGAEVIGGRTFSTAALNHVDLTNISHVRIVASGPMEVRIGSEKGRIIGKTSTNAADDEMQETTIKIDPVTGQHDVYFVFAVTKSGFVLQQRLKQVTFISASLYHAL